MPEGRIFISYRRGADSNAAGRLYGRLERTFGGERLFFDVDSIPPGVDFVNHLNDQVGQCQAFLAVIGSGWVEDIERLHDPNDFVRIEIEAALNRPHIPIIPVLIDDAGMPKADDLPNSLQALVRRAGVPLRHEHFAAVVDGRLTRALKRALGESDDGDDEDADISDHSEATARPQPAAGSAAPRPAEAASSAPAAPAETPPRRAPRRFIRIASVVVLLAGLGGLAGWKLLDIGGGSDGRTVVRKLDPEFVTLVRQLGSDDGPVRRSASKTLSTRGLDLVQPAMHVLATANTDEGVRRELVIALTVMMRENKSQRARISKLLSARDLDVLIRMATDDDRQLRIHAAEFLYDLGDPRAFDLAVKRWGQAELPDARYNLALIMKGAAPYLDPGRRAAAKRTLTGLKGVVGEKTDALLDDAIRLLPG